MMIKPKLEDYKFPITENELDQYIGYAYDLEEYCNELEKALNKACEYIHNDGIDGCPSNYDISAITNEKMNECNICGYQCNGQLNSSKQQNYKYLKKSIKCWKEYFLKGDQQNESK